MSLILGIASSHDASACVFRDGQLVAAISEERLSRIKCDGGHLPNLAIDACLKMAGATRQEVDHIASIYGHFPDRYLRRPTLAKNVERTLSRLVKGLRGKTEETHYYGNNILKYLRDEPSVQGKGKRFDTVADLMAELNADD